MVRHEWLVLGPDSLFDVFGTSSTGGCRSSPARLSDLLSRFAIEGLTEDEDPAFVHRVWRRQPDRDARDGPV
jgi:hypothetical protein